MVLVGVSIYLYFISSDQSKFLNAIPLIATIALAIQKILPSLQQTYSSYTNITGAFGAVDSVMRIINKPNEESINLNFIKRRTNKKFIFKDLKIKNCTFKFKDNLPTVLKIPCMEFKAGEKIGIIGSSGSGKSTLVDLISGLIKPVSGEILVNGIDINSKNLLKQKLIWQNSLSVVSQNIFINDDSIKKNIAFGENNENIDLNRIKEVAKQVGASEFINNTKNGYETIVGERGFSLSGGQLQRIALARGLYKNSKVLIFDEATSALDRETEQIVLDSIKKFYNEALIIMISHRKESLDFCDRLLTIKNKKLIEI